MRICGDHWLKLKKAIDDRGLSKFIKDEQALRQQVEDELNGVMLEDGHDPLLSCNSMIFSRGLECGGLYLMLEPLCPICEAIKHQTGMRVGGEKLTAQQIEDHWIQGPADAELKWFIDRGLVKVN